MSEGGNTGQTVRYPLPWNWEELDQQEFLTRLGQLARWVDWLVDRYHLARKLPACWYLHPTLVDELKALWYYHQQVYNPLVTLVEPEDGGDPTPALPGVTAREYWEWHWQRTAWMTGSLHTADGYRECLSKREHIDDAHATDADAHATTSAEGLATAIKDGLVAP